MHSYFISDLHLTPERPAITEAFLAFMAGPARSAEKLYLLGDLFEYWIGDDAAPLIGAEPVLRAMRELAEQIPCIFIAGNRDFLVGQQFTETSGFEILDDETVVDLYGEPTLILHGDSMCTDDIAHQQFRQAMMTNQDWRNGFLALPIPERIQSALEARKQSHQHKANISMEIMDVTKQTVLDTFTKFNVKQMIHGHTHRQANHEYLLDGQVRNRYVLGDWGTTSSILIASAEEIKIENFEISS
ncbi:MAG: UDP-2,3-diacylglucosamine hydrolase [Arenicella sp.]|jgi:UDP-2,3-diacylglucosamine hydrolase